MTPNLRLAAVSDLDEVVALFQAAICNMVEHNILQWDEIYPARDDIEADIQNQEMYCLMEEGKIAAVMVINAQQALEYSEGNWQFPHLKAAVLHRLCVHPAFQNRGLGRQMTLYAEEIARERGHEVLRLDAFSQNPHALVMYESLGYLHAGSVTFRKGMFFLFEKKLSRKG